MSRSRRPASALGLAVFAVAALAACTPGGAQASEPTTATASDVATPSEVPAAAETTPIEVPTPPEATPTEAAPQPVAADPADVTSWEVSAAGIGPIDRGAAYPEMTDQLGTFEASEMCPGVVTFSKDATAGVLVMLSADGSRIASVWVSGRAGANGTVPASPMTATGIHLGSSSDEFAAAYPDLVPVAQMGADTYGYAIGDDASGWIDVIVEGDVVTMMGSSEVPRTPKEFCG